MTVIGDAFIAVRPDTDARAFGNEVERSVEGPLARVSKGVGKAVAVGAAAAAAGVAATVAIGVNGAVQVERGLREVVTLTGQVGEEAAATLATLTEGVGDLSNEIGIAQEELTAGLYSAISAGVPQDNAFEFLETAGKAAVAGVTDIETSVDGLTTVINAFGLEASDAQEVSDSLFAAVQGGKTTFEELSASLFNVGPAAAAAGVNFQEVNAAIATLTAGGTPTSVATTQIRAALVGLQRPSEEMTAIFNELGFESAQMAVEQEGLAFALDAVAEEAEGDNGKLQQLLGSTEAVAAANVLAGTGAEKFRDELERQQDAAGATDDAFAVMEEGVGRQFEKLVNNLRNIAIEIGQAILPVLNEIVTFAVDNLPAIRETLGRVFGGLRTILAPVVAVVTSIIDAFRGAEDSIGGAGEGIGEVVGTLGGIFEAWFEVVSGTLGGVIDIVMAVAATVEEWIADNRATIEAFAVVIREVFTTIGTTIRTVYEAVSTLTSAVLSVIANAWDRFGRGLLDRIANALGGILQAFRGVFQVIQGVLEVFIGIFTGDWERAWEGVLGILEGAWNLIVGVVRAALATVRAVIEVALGLIQSIWEGIWGGIQSFFGSIWDTIVRGVTGYVDTVRGIIDGFLGGIQSAWETTWDAVGSFFAGVWEGIETAFTGSLNFVIDGLNSFTRFLAGLDFTVNLPDFVPGLPDEFTVGFPDLPQIARLAQGGLAFDPTLAVVGDNAGRGEAIVPLDELPAILREALGGMPAGGPLVGQVTMVVDDPARAGKSLLDRLRDEQFLASGSQQIGAFT